MFGQSVATLAALSGANNPVNNFFASQINNANGTLDTSGTFGNRNANAATGTNTYACRQGWDITAVDVSDRLAASQIGAVIRFTSDGDLYVSNALALLIDSKGANLSVVKSVDDPSRSTVNFSENTNTVSVQIISNRITNVKSVDKAYAVSGDNLHYTSVITNTGSLLKSNLVFTDPIPAGTTFVSGSVRINGVVFAAYDPQVGFALPDIAVGDVVIVEFDVTVN